MPRKKLYPYDRNRRIWYAKFADLVSEKPIPRRTKIAAVKGLCVAKQRIVFPKAALVPGAVNDLLWGDPVVFRKARMLSLAKNPIPKEAEYLSCGHRHDKDVIVFQYRGGRVWACVVDVCLLNDVI